MTLEHFRNHYPKTHKKFISSGKYVVLSKNQIDGKLEEFLCEEGYILNNIFNLDLSQHRPYIKYHENISGIKKDPIFNDFKPTTKSDTRHITLPVALKHYEEHI